MILLTAMQMPSGIDKNTIAAALQFMFPHPDNRGYIENVRARENNASAAESLFALSLLYEQIRSLPSRVDTKELVFLRTENGKPYFKDSSLKFNISHSKGYVACAVSEGANVGVDIEASSLQAERALKMAERYFSKSEIETVKTAPESFSRIWSEKEAKSKFSGENLGFLLENEKKGVKTEEEFGLTVHRFAIGKIPISLCTIRDFQTISFTVQ